MFIRYFASFLINTFFLILIPLKKKNKNNIYYIFVHNHNALLYNLENLLIKNNLKYIIITKDKNISKKKNIFTVDIFSFNYLFLNKKNKFFICNSSYDCLPFVFFDNRVIFYIYDIVNGRKILFLYKFLENILFRKIKFLISRSLIFKKKYKKYFNKYQIINFINLDTSRFKKFVGKKKDKNFLIIGYFDNSTVSFFNLCLKILKKNYKIYVSLQKEYRENFYLLKKSLGAKNIDTEKLILIDYDDIEKIQDQITYGICPHDNIMTTHTVEYIKHCSSSRIADYINLNLITILDTSAEFQVYLVNHSKKKYIDYNKFLKNDINYKLSELTQYKKKNFHSEIKNFEFKDLILQYDNF